MDGSVRARQVVKRLHKQPHQKIGQLAKEVSGLRDSIRSILTPELFDQVCKRALDESMYEKTECRNRLKGKINKMLVKRRSLEPDVSQRRWVVNLSSKELTPAQVSIFSKGLNFAPAPQRILIPCIVAAIEQGLNGMKEL